MTQAISHFLIRFVIGFMIGTSAAMLINVVAFQLLT
jgi:hypothetical protein